MAPLRASVHQPLYCTRLMGSTYCTVKRTHAHTIRTTVTPGRCLVWARAAFLAGSVGVHRPHQNDFYKSTTTSCLRHRTDLAEQSGLQMSVDGRRARAHMLFILPQKRRGQLYSPSTTTVIYGLSPPYILHHPLLWYTQNDNYDNNNNYPYKIPFTALGSMNEPHSLLDTLCSSVES